jgi:hypothetical protein
VRLLIVLTAWIAAAATSAPPAVEDLSWLAGNWERTTPTGKAEEVWLPPADGVMAGVGRTLRQDRAPLVEFMKITTEAAGITFTAVLPNQAPTSFVLVRGGPDEAVFENPTHDFPQRVIYRRCDADLCARIEGGVTAQEWRYERVLPPQ